MAEAAGKRCLYEVLGVERDCSADEIRAAYKRRALQLHPDKLASSGLSPADATAAFQELAHAYEVLSDTHRRSWYDSRRSHLLFSTAASSSTSPSSDLDLSTFFSPAAFSGFSDAGRGFYKVYSDLFFKIYGRELHYCSQMGLPSDSIPPAPLMGNLDSPYSQVTAFYNYWLAFSTVMDFAWVDAFDSSSAGANRRFRRLMEEENKKARRKARREYSDTVHGLAAYVKKRDKRVIDMQVKKKEEEQKRREKELARRKKEQERKRVEQARAYEEPEWARIDEEEEEEVEEVAVGEEEKMMKELYCVVCNKKFKSDKQWKNHEQSRKHRDKVAELKDSFKEELAEGEGEGEEDGEEIHVSCDYVPQPKDEERSHVVDELCEEFEDAVGMEEKNENASGAEEKFVVEDEDGDEASILEAMLSGRKSRKSGYVAPGSSLHRKDSLADDGEQTTAMEYDTRRRSRRNRGKRRGPSAEADDEEAVRGETSEVRQDDAELQSREHNSEDTKENSSCLVEEVAARSKSDQVADKNHKSKKQPAEVKGGKKATNFETKNSSKGRKQKVASKAPSNACETCGESFDSRNKLFAHLGDTGHTALKSR